MKHAVPFLLLRLASLWAAVLPLLGAPPAFKVANSDSKPWTNIFSSIGVRAAAGDEAEIIVAAPDASPDLVRTAEDHILILQGDSPLARQFGITPKSETVSVRRIIDTHSPATQIIWAEPQSAPVFDLPPGFQVFAREKWKDAPVEAGKRTAHGAILWMATAPGPEGTERYPYLLHALSDLGLSLPLRATGLWSFFDSAYRSRADVDYLARRWRNTGISALHVASWHNMEPNAERDDYLARLIAACHRNAILVYAWLELPHVSDEFWAQHPEWREKTALGQDAQLDWRKLMNLQNADCKRAAAQQVRQLLKRFDWDGVNLAELYFESLEGAANPARFTPMNADVRRDFQEDAGFDPQRLFDPASPHSAQYDPAALRRFLDFRARLASHMQSEWLEVVDNAHSQKPWLDVVLTHIDDRLEPGMRGALGADTQRSLPYIQAHQATVLIEDPAPLWNLGAARYALLGEKWRALPLPPEKLAVDINVVERYQDVYPTKKQTGTELFELVHEAAATFPRVALYFENSIERADLDLLSVAAARGRITETTPDELTVNAARPVRLMWSGPAEVDGKPWPLRDASTLLLPAGTHLVSVGVKEPPVGVADFNGTIGAVAVEGDTVEISYKSATRALTVVDSTTATVDIDGTPFWRASEAGGDRSIVLPAGEHVVSIHK